MKKLVLFVLLMVFPITLARGQGGGYVQTTGTKACYANGSVNASFINQSTTPGLPLLSGSVFPQTAVTNFDSSGNFAFFLADNNLIFPGPSQWKFTACQKSGAQPLCGTTQLTITGTSPQDISAALAGFPCPATPGGSVAPPASAVQFASIPSATGNQSDILAANVNPVSHTFNTQNLTTSVQPVINPAAYGAIGDGTSSSTASFTAGSNIITIPAGTSNTPPVATKGITIRNAGLQGTSANVTACSVTNNVVTFTAANSFKGTEPIVPNGFTGGCAFLNKIPLAVLATNLSGTSFNANLTHANLGTTADAGAAVETIDMIGTITSVTDPTHVVASVTPQVTVAGAGLVSWWTDNTAAINSVVGPSGVACSATFFPRGSVGAKVPMVSFPQGEFHITNTINWQCGQWQGIRGAAGTRIIWDGANNGIGLDRLPTGPGNGSMSGIQFLQDSNNFVPANWIKYEELVDQFTNWSDLQFSGCTQACNAFTKGFVNFHMTQLRYDAFCGDAINMLIAPGQGRENFALDMWTADTGSVVQTAQNCTTRSVINWDNSVAQTPTFGNIRLSNARIEGQITTLFTTPRPSIFKFTTGNTGGSAAVIPPIELDNITFNFINPNQTLAIFDTDDAGGAACPPYLLQNVSYNNQIAAGWTSASGSWCGGKAIVQPPAFASGEFAIGWYTYDGNRPSTMLPWFGRLSKNKVSDTEIKAPAAYWTLDAGYTVQQNCGGGGGNCFQRVGNGSPSGFGHVTSNPIPVKPSTLYTYSGFVDCTGNPTGNLGWSITGTGVSTPNGLCTPGSKDTFTGTITTGASTTFVQMIVTTGNATIPSGAVLTFSQPQLVEGSVLTPYQPNDFDDTTGNVLPAALPIATNTNVGVVKPDNSTVTVNSQGVLSASPSGGANATSIQGTAVSATAPTNGQVLLLVGGVYAPTTLSGTFAAGGDLSGSSTSQIVTGINTVNLAALGTGLVKITAGTPSLASTSTDVIAPGAPFAGQELAPIGACGTPAYSFNSNTTTGVCYNNSGQIGIGVAFAGVVHEVTNANKVLGSTTGMCWSSGNPAANGPDSCFWRDSSAGAKNVDFGGPSANDFTGTLHTSIFNAAIGYKLNGAAPAAHYLRGNATNYVDSAIQYADLPTTPNNFVSRARTTALGSTTLLTTTATALYRVNGSVNCDTTVAAATVTLTVTYTDPSSTAQTFTTSPATCTTLGTSSVASVNSQVFSALTGTAIAVSTTISGSPNYDVAATVEQLTTN